jgi:hypothetical protein
VNSATVQAAGYGAEILEPTFVLEPTQTRVTGLVVDAGGRGLAGVELIAAGHPPVRKRSAQLGLASMQPSRASTRSDANGHFDLPDLPSGMVYITASLDGRISAAVQATLKRGVETGLEIVLQEAPLVRGRVRSEAGQALAGARLEIPNGAHRPKLVYTDRDGHFEVHAVSCDGIEITASHQDAHRVRRFFELPDIAVAAVPPIDIALPARATIRGTLVDERGAALPGFAVEARSDGSDETTLSDREGRFEVGARSGERHTLTVFAASAGPTVRIAERADVAADGSELRIVVRDEHRATASVVAQFRRPPDYPSEILRVALLDERNRYVHVAGLPQSGALRVGPLAPGSYVLRTHGTGSRFGGDELARFTLAPDQTLDLGTIAIPAPVVPELRAKTSNGRVIDALSGRLFALADRRDCGPIGLQDGETHWRPPLRPGEYTLRIDDGDGFAGRELQISLRAGPPNQLDLMLEARARVSVTPRAADGLALPRGLEFELLHQDGVRSKRSWNGFPLRFSLADGRHRLAVLHDQLEGAIEISADAQQAEPLELVLTVTARR